MPAPCQSPAAPARSTRAEFPLAEFPHAGVPAERLVVLLYTELRSLAGSHMRSERRGHTLTPTVLVHEAFMKLAAERHLWQTRAQFFSAAAEAMRRVLINHAVRRNTLKRGGGGGGRDGSTAGGHSCRLDIDGVSIAVNTGGVDPLVLQPALVALEAADPEGHRVVMHRYFAGLSFAQVAKMTRNSERTCKRQWERARLYLLDHLGE